MKRNEKKLEKYEKLKHLNVLAFGSRNGIKFSVFEI